MNIPTKIKKMPISPAVIPELGSGLPL